MSDRAPRVVCAALLVLAVCACGAPTVSPARPVATVPRELTTTPSPASPTTTAAQSGGPAVYLVRGDVLVAAAPVPPSASPRETAARALDRLAEGATDAELAAGLASALGPEARVSLLDLADGRATVDLRAGQQPRGPGRLALAVGQIVLTLTSVEGCDDVVLTSSGEPLPAPLPGGGLTDRPLRRADYASLAQGPQSPTTGPLPPPTG